MNQQKWLIRIRKRELRTLHREKRLGREKALREEKGKTSAKEQRIYNKAIEVLREDNKKSGKPDKKPGPNTFLKVYSYIPSTGFDTRYNIPSMWKPQSFNQRKQHLEFLKCFVYPYPLPETLLWATHGCEYTLDNRGRRINTPVSAFIKLAKKWVKDIVSGESFYKLNKKFFTKAEAHYFLCSKLPYTDESSVLKLYFYARCRARGIKHKLSLMIADVFTVKFSSHFKVSLVESFLDLLARTPEYRYERGMLGDLSDFVLAKIRETKGKLEIFTFSGRTITSVIKLANEWHYYLRQEAETQRTIQRALTLNRQEGRKNEKPIDTSRWNGMGISQFRANTKEYSWTVTELLTAQDLLNEGRKMKNCVSSYAVTCASGKSSIFSVEYINPEIQIIEKVVTVEVNRANRSMIQAKGKCNSAISPRALKVITQWAEANSIKMKLVV